MCLCIYFQNLAKRLDRHVPSDLKELKDMGATVKGMCTVAEVLKATGKESSYGGDFHDLLVKQMPVIRVEPDFIPTVCTCTPFTCCVCA